MEYRKLIKFGKNSFIISLPKTWVEHNKLKKGSLVHVQPNGHQLMLMAKPEGTQDNLSETVIDLDKFPVSSLQRIITSAYINNVRIMNITGKKLAENSQRIRSIMHNLMALEIVEQSPTRIVARDYLNMAEISIEGLVRKSDNIIRSMFLDTLAALKPGQQKGKFGDEIYSRDLDVNRLTYLALRAVKFQVANPLLIEQEYTSEDLVHIWEVAQNIERIADELKYIAKVLPQLDERLVLEFSKMVSEVQATYVAVMKAHYTKNHADAILLGERRKTLMDLVSSVLQQKKPTPESVMMTEHLRNLVRSVHNLNRMTYQRPIPA